MGKENLCDKKVENRQMSLKVLCERFLHELGRTEGTLEFWWSLSARLTNLKQEQTD